MGNYILPIDHFVVAVREPTEGNGSKALDPNAREFIPSGIHFQIYCNLENTLEILNPKAKIFALSNNKCFKKHQDKTPTCAQ